MKKLLIATFILFIAAVVSGAVLQKTDAQNKYGYDCAKEYQTRKLGCLDDMKACDADCDRAYPFDPDAATRCKVMCSNNRNSCDALADNEYRECLGLGAPDQDLPAVDIDAQPTLPITPAPTPIVSPPQITTPPPTTAPKPPESSIDVGDDSGNLELPPTSNLPEEITVGGINHVPALVENPPTDKDFQPVPFPDDERRDPLTATITKLTGMADIQLADGTWIEAKEGSIIPNDAIIFSGYDSKVELEFSNSLTVIVRPLSEMSIKIFETDSMQYYTDLKLGTGELRFKVEKGEYKVNLRPATPNSSGRPQGTDFGAVYNKDTGESIWEIYDGSIEVTSNLTGEKRTISSSYGLSVRRIEIARDGMMAEKIAIPQSEWPMFVTKQQKSRSNAWVWILVILVIGGIGYFAYRKKDELMKIIKKEPKQST